MRDLMLTFAVCFAVLLAGLVAVFKATEGGTAYTTETLRRSAVAQAPAPVPNFTVIDATGKVQPLRDLLAKDGRVWIVDFVYTRCMTLCLALGTIYQQLQTEISARGLQQQVGLLSISFDPANDRPAELGDYARRMKMDGAVWELVSLKHPADRRQLLDSFGIMVVPAPLGEFEHNAALHVVTPDGNLVRILGLAEGADALDLAAALHAGVQSAQHAPMQSGRSARSALAAP